MSEIVVMARGVEDTQAGPIVELAFHGHYPPGSAGNEPCAKMIDRGRQLLAEHGFAGVLFNLAELDYIWGDSILGLA